MHSMDNRQKNGPSANALQVKAVADGCLRGEIPCFEVHRRIFPHLCDIISARGSEQDNKAHDGPASSGKQGIANTDANHRLAQSFKADEECLIQSLRVLVQRLGVISDPLEEIYILGAQVFADFRLVISEEECDKLYIFQDLAHEEALLFDEDRSLTTAAAHELRRQIRDAVSNYLSAP